MVYTAPLAWTPALVRKVAVYLLATGRHLSHEKFISCFQGQRKVKMASLPLWLLMSLKQHAEVASFRVLRSEPLQSHDDGRSGEKIPGLTP